MTKNTNIVVQCSMLFYQQLKKYVFIILLIYINLIYSTVINIINNH